jgi:hypothetical protein
MMCFGRLQAERSSIAREAASFASQMLKARNTIIGMVFITEERRLT